MIDNKDLGMDPRLLTQKLGLSLCVPELPGCAPEIAKSEAEKAAAVRELYRFVLPLWPYMVTIQEMVFGVTDDYKGMSCEEIVEHNIGRMQRLDVPGDNLRRKSAEKFISSVVHGIINITPDVAKSGKFQEFPKVASQPKHLDIDQRLARRNELLPSIEGICAVGVATHDLITNHSSNTEGARSSINQILGADPLSKSHFQTISRIIGPYQSTITSMLESSSNAVLGERQPVEV